MPSPFDVINPPKEKLQRLLCGEVIPQGWIRDQMKQDLKGFIGHLDQLVPNLIKQDDIYGKNRLTKTVKTKRLGNVRQGHDIDAQYLWWNSETQSNWRDGLIRHAILLDDQSALRKAAGYIQRILRLQDADGYLGIYDTDLRYRFSDENGELWSKATLLRGLLAWYEYSRDERVLQSIISAVKNVMHHYPVNASDPFQSKNLKSGGLTHGLMFTDVLDRLHQITGDRKYLDYGLFLYRSFSAHEFEEDARLSNILNPEYKLKGHGVHTYEHLRSLTLVYYATGNPELKKALQIFVSRIEKEITPAGGPVGDEWILERTADATHTGYEYCSLQEMLDSWAMLMQKTGESAWGDSIENLFFNAAQGARHPQGRAIAYCKTDNSLAITGTLNGARQTKKKQLRFKYSPTHQDVAVCCVPNAGRIAPYFVNAMWRKDESGLVATLLGPCELNTRLHGTSVRIGEKTGYPFSNRFTFHISLGRSIEFTLRVRKPSWVKRLLVSESYREENGYLLIRKKWKKQNSVKLEFFAEPQVRFTGENECYITSGALVYALPVKSRNVVSKKYPIAGYADIFYTPVLKTDYSLDVQRVNISGVSKLKTKNPFSANQLHVTLYNRRKKKFEQVTLIPIGGTLLRRVTFIAEQNTRHPLISKEFPQRAKRKKL